MEVDKNDSYRYWMDIGLRLRKENYSLIDDDFQELDRILKEEWFGHFVLHILDYQKSFPKFLFYTLIDKLVESRDKRYIYPCIRVFGGKTTNKRILELVRNSNGRKKCDALFVLYYCVDEKYRWNKETDSYETDYSHLTEVGNDTSKMHDRGRYIIDVTLGKKFYVSNESFIFDRYDFLLNQLLDQKNNLIIKYHIKLLLPNNLGAYPEELMNKANDALKLIKKLNIPDDSIGLERRIKGNIELEEFAYEELNWKRTPKNNLFSLLKGILKK